MFMDRIVIRIVIFMSAITCSVHLTAHGTFLPQQLGTGSISCSTACSFPFQPPDSDTFFQAGFSCPFPSVLVDHIDFMPPAHHVTHCFSQAMPAGGELGDGDEPGAPTVPWDQPCNAVS